MPAEFYAELMPPTTAWISTVHLKNTDLTVSVSPVPVSVHDLCTEDWSDARARQRVFRCANLDRSSRDLRTIDGEVLHQLALWCGRQMDLTLAVKVAPLMLKDTGLPARLLANLRQFDIPPGMLTLEVQKTVALADREQFRDASTRLRLSGVDLALDDFGIGVSSLNEFYRMPFSEVKIVGSLIADISKAHETAVIVRSLIDLAHDLSITMGAEGLESSSTLELLADARCDLIQGGLICAPGPPHKLGRFLRSAPAGRREAAHA